MEAIFTRLTISLILSCSIISCSSIPQDQPLISQIPDNSGSVILFNERSTTDPEHISRFIITEKFLRIDYGNDTDDFMLFDRREKIIYNVVHEDRSIMTIKNKELTTKHVALVNWQETTEKSHALPRLPSEENGMATHHKLSLQGKPCYDIVALDSILKEENAAIVEYYNVLALELMKSYKASQESLCFDMINVLDPDQRFSYGFPYREWSNFGYQRFMVSFRQKLIFPDNLFKLPNDYRQY